MIFSLLLFVAYVIAGLFLLILCPLAMDYLIRRAPLAEAPTTRSRKMGSPKARIKHLQQLRDHHLDQLEAIEREFVDLHGIEWGTDAAGELRRVIRDREDYAMTIKRLKAKAKR